MGVAKERSREQRPKLPGLHKDCLRNSGLAGHRAAKQHPAVEEATLVTWLGFNRFIAQHREDKREGVTLTQSVSDRWWELNLKMSAQDGTCSEGNAQQGYPSLCKNGCGFFSSVDSKGFCSVCYKDFLKKEQSSTEATEEVADTTASL